MISMGRQDWIHQVVEVEEASKALVDSVVLVEEA